MSEQVIEGYRLSPHQKHVWLSAQQDRTAYRSVCAMALDGPLDVARLKSAISEAVMRHEILRTSFQRMAGMKVPVQVIDSENSFGWKRVDLSGADAERQAATVREVYEQECQRRDEVNQETVLLQATLVDMASESYVLVLGLPALCADSWTLRNLVDEIRRSYSADGHSIDQSADEVTQYLQFSEWQNEMLESEDEESQRGRAYWRKQAEAALIELTLPFEARPTMPQPISAATPEGVAVQIDATVVEAFDTLAADHNSSAANVLFACWQMLLCRLSGQAEVTVKYVCDGRQYEEMHQAAGLFAKAVPIRSEIKGETRLSSLVQHVGEALSEATEWQAFYNWELGSREEEKKGAGPIGYEYGQYPARQFADGVGFEVKQQQSRIERFKLKLNCVRVGASLQAEIEYDPRVYELSNYDWVEQ